jgi:hypothetical protein
MSKPKQLNPMEMLAQMYAQHEAEADETPKIDTQAAIMRLKEVAARHLEADKGPRFEVGDIITPAADALIKGAGEPHIVISVRKTEHNFSPEGHPGTQTYGPRYDTRIVCFTPKGDVGAYWVESAEFIPWAAR